MDFLTLPGEVRTLVYHHYFAKRHATSWPTKEPGAPYDGPVIAYNIPTALLETSKLVRQEASSLLKCIPWTWTISLPQGNSMSVIATLLAKAIPDWLFAHVEELFVELSVESLYLSDDWRRYIDDKTTLMQAVHVDRMVQLRRGSLRFDTRWRHSEDLDMFPTYDIHETQLVAIRQVLSRLLQMDQKGFSPDEQQSRPNVEIDVEVNLIVRVFGTDRFFTDKIMLHHNHHFTACEEKWILVKKLRREGEQTASNENPWLPLDASEFDPKEHATL